MAERLELEITTPPAERFDRWLAAQLPQLSRSRLQKLLEDGQVTVNGQPCDGRKTKLRTGDRLEVCLPDPEPLELVAQDIPLSVLYEDGDLLILDKPAGMVVHPSAGHSDGTLVNAILAHCGDSLQGIGGELRPGIVHRLDKDTTGAIVVAKNEAALLHLQTQIKAKTARREYLGLVFGSPRLDRGAVEQPLGRHPVDRKKQAIVPEERGGRWARTHWQVVERLGNYALLQFQLETGRTHQIRVHSASIGHPIVGDPLYSRGHSPLKLTGQALHAWRLGLDHPRTGERITVEAPLPAEFNRLHQYLRRLAQQP